MKLSVVTITCLALVLTTPVAVAQTDSMERTPLRRQEPVHRGSLRLRGTDANDQPHLPSTSSSIDRPEDAAATPPAGRQLQNPARTMRMMTRTPTRRPQMKPPTRKRTRKPTRKPIRTRQPTRRPNRQTRAPSHNPTNEPTHLPSRSPTNVPTQPPTAMPTSTPSFTPTQKPTAKPSPHPTVRPTQPLSQPPTRQPTTQPEPEFCQDTKLFPDNGHRYALVKTFLSYQQAVQYVAQLPACCGGKKAQLATIAGQSETNFLAGMLRAAFSPSAWFSYNGKKNDRSTEDTLHGNLFPRRGGCAFLTSLGRRVAYDNCIDLKFNVLVEYDCEP